MLIAALRELSAVYISTVLICAAVLKLHEMMASGASVVEGAAAVLELMAGVWLALARMPRLPALGAVALFGAFLGYQAGRLVDGLWSMSCPCFGTRAVSFPVLLDLDLAGLGGAALLAVCPGGELRVSRLHRLAVSAGVLVPLLILPSRDAANISVLKTVSLGTGHAHEDRLVGLRVVSAADHPESIIGVRADCGVAILRGVPTVVEPGGRSTLWFRIHWPAARGKWVRSAVLLTGNGARIPIVFRGETSEDVYVRGWEVLDHAASVH